MNFRLLLCAAALSLLCVSAKVTSGSEAGAERSIAVLISHRAGPYEDVLKGFAQYLSDAGVSVRLEVHHLEGDRAEAARVLERLPRGTFDLALSLGTFAAREALDRDISIPVIAGMVLREDDLHSVGGDVPGVTLEHPLAIQFRYLRKILPEARRVGVIFHPEENGELIARAAVVAEGMGMELVPWQVTDPREIPTALDELSRKADVLWGVADKLVLNPKTAEQFLLFSFRQRIPLIGLSPNWVKAGALYSLGWDYGDIGAQCAEISLAILRNGRAGSPSLEPPREIRYFVNQKTAKRMKVKLPESFLAGAHKVF